MKRLVPLALLAVALLASGCRSRQAAATYPTAVEHEIGLLKPPAALEPGMGWYTLQKGDTLYAVARRHGLTVEGLIQLNPALGDVRTLAVGTVLRVPLHGAAAPRPEVSTPTAPPEPPPAKGPPEPARKVDYLWPARGAVVVRFGEALPGAPPARCRGIEIAVEPGEEVRAVRSGVAYVVRTSMPGFGNALAIDHGNGLTSFYGYALVTRVRNEERVQQGQVVAQASRIAPARLHFRIEQEGKPVDPLQYLSAAP